MKVVLVSLYFIHMLTVEATGPKNIDLNVETVIELEPKPKDLTIIDNVQNFLSKIKSAIAQPERRAIHFKESLTFTEFLAKLLDILQSYNDDDLKDATLIFCEEIKKYHYKGCKFHEIVTDTDTRQQIREIIDDLRKADAKAIRRKVNKLAFIVQFSNWDAKALEILNYGDSLYGDESTGKFNKFLSKLHQYGVSNVSTKRSGANLTNVIKDGLRSIVFDHVSDLHVNVRKDLKTKLEALNKQTKRSVDESKSVQKDDKMGDIINFMNNKDGGTSQDFLNKFFNKPPNLKMDETKKPVQRIHHSINIAATIPKGYYTAINKINTLYYNESITLKTPCNDKKVERNKDSDESDVNKETTANSKENFMDFYVTTEPDTTLNPETMNSDYYDETTTLDPDVGDDGDKSNDDDGIPIDSDSATTESITAAYDDDTIEDTTTIKPKTHINSNKKVIARNKNHHKKHKRTKTSKKPKHADGFYGKRELTTSKAKKRERSKITAMNERYVNDDGKIDYNIITGNKNVVFDVYKTKNNTFIPRLRSRAHKNKTKKATKTTRTPSSMVTSDNDDESEVGMSIEYIPYGRRVNEHISTTVNYIKNVQDIENYIIFVKRKMESAIKRVNNSKFVLEVNKKINDYRNLNIGNKQTIKAFDKQIVNIENKQPNKADKNKPESQKNIANKNVQRSKTVKNTPIYHQEMKTNKNMSRFETVKNTPIYHQRIKTTKPVRRNQAKKATVKIPKRPNIATIATKQHTLSTIKQSYIKPITNVRSTATQRPKSVTRNVIKQTTQIKDKITSKKTTSSKQTAATIKTTVNYNTKTINHETTTPKIVYDKTTTLKVNDKTATPKPFKDITATTKVNDITTKRSVTIALVTGDKISTVSLKTIPIITSPTLSPTRTTFTDEIVEKDNETGIEVIKVKKNYRRNSNEERLNMQAVNPADFGIFLNDKKAMEDKISEGIASLKSSQEFNDLGFLHDVEKGTRNDNNKLLDEKLVA